MDNGHHNGNKYPPITMKLINLLKKITDNAITTLTNLNR